MGCCTTDRRADTRSAKRWEDALGGTPVTPVVRTILRGGERPSRAEREAGDHCSQESSIRSQQSKRTGDDGDDGDAHAEPKGSHRYRAPRAAQSRDHPHGHHRTDNAEEGRNRRRAESRCIREPDYRRSLLLHTCRGGGAPRHLALPNRGPQLRGGELLRDFARRGSVEFQSASHKRFLVRPEPS